MVDCKGCNQYNTILMKGQININIVMEANNITRTFNNGCGTNLTNCNRWANIYRSKLTTNINSLTCSFERFWSLGCFEERKYRPLQIILLQAETRFWRKCHLLPRERMSKMSILSSLTYQVIWATSGRPHYKGNRRGMYQWVMEKKQFYENHCKNAKTEDF